MVQSWLLTINTTKAKEYQSRGSQKAKAQRLCLRMAKKKKKILKILYHSFQNQPSNILILYIDCINYLLLLFK